MNNYFNTIVNFIIPHPWAEGCSTWFVYLYYHTVAIQTQIYTSYRSDILQRDGLSTKAGKFIQAHTVCQFENQKNNYSLTLLHQIKSTIKCET